MPKFETKTAWLICFGAGIWKQYCHISNQHLRICLTAKFRGNKKCLNLGPNMPDLGVFGLEFENNIALFEISTLEFHEKRQMPKSGTKNAWFIYFGAGISKQHCHISNQNPRICLAAKFRGKTKMPKFRTKNALFGISDQEYFIWVFLG